MPAPLRTTPHSSDRSNLKIVLYDRRAGRRLPALWDSPRGWRVADRSTRRIGEFSGESAASTAQVPQTLGPAPWSNFSIEWDIK